MQWRRQVLDESTRVLELALGWSAHPDITDFAPLVQQLSS
jgi:hypothetical protein